MAPLKVLLKEPLSKRSILFSLTFDSSLLISRGLWLKTAVYSFTFNHSLMEGLTLKKKTSKITSEEKKVLNNLFMMLLRQSHVLLAHVCLRCDAEVSKEELQEYIMSINILHICSPNKQCLSINKWFQ